MYKALCISGLYDFMYIYKISKKTLPKYEVISTMCAVPYRPMGIFRIFNYYEEWYRIINVKTTLKNKLKRKAKMPSFLINNHITIILILLLLI